MKITQFATTGSPPEKFQQRPSDVEAKIVARASMKQNENQSRTSSSAGEQAAPESDSALAALVFRIRILSLGFVLSVMVYAVLLIGDAFGQSLLTRLSSLPKFQAAGLFAAAAFVATFLLPEILASAMARGARPVRIKTLIAEVLYCAILLFAALFSKEEHGVLQGLARYFTGELYWFSIVGVVLVYLQPFFLFQDLGSRWRNWTSRFRS